MPDLRQWLSQVNMIDGLKNAEGADWENEIGALTALNFAKKDCPAILFNNIKDYPEGYRVLTCSTSSRKLLALTFGVSSGNSDIDLVTTFRQKWHHWEAQMTGFTPETVNHGAVAENVVEGKGVDIFKFPGPKWHELDGGRYIGTGDAVITRDPENGKVNLGTYRVQMHDASTAGLFMTPGKHARLNIEKYHSLGKPCPVAISVGHHPLILRVAGMRLTEGAEYSFIGAVRGEPVKVIREEVTGLPIPADSEIVLVGWCFPGQEREEGPFGEWVGYYASAKEPAPTVHIERIYHRNSPIILGSPPGRVQTDSSYYRVIVGSAFLHNELEKAGIPDIKGVCLHPSGLDLLIIISLRQRYAGHARQAGLLAMANRTTGSLGRYLIVVDEDIDPTDTQAVLWAVCTRSDPQTDIDIVRRMWSSTLDPMIKKPSKALFNSRAIIDACKPFEWLDEFPKEIKISDELKNAVEQKWGDKLKLGKHGY